MKSLKATTKSNQLGLTLIEMIAALGISGLILGGALALYQNASSSNSSRQMSADLTAVRAAVKQLYNGQGGYGVASLNTILINANKIPSTMSVAGAVLTHPLNGTLTITGATANFTMTATNISTDVCVNLITTATGYSSIQVGANAARVAFPITPAIASTDCAAAANQTIVFTSN